MNHRLHNPRELREWLDHVPREIDPIEYRLRGNDGLEERVSGLNWVREFRGHVNIQPASGLARIAFERTDELLMSLEKHLEGLGALVDERPVQHLPGGEYGRTPLLAEYRSAVRIPNSGDQVPVIGPGGRILAFALPNVVFADVVMRSRGALLPARWRGVDEVFARMPPYLSVSGTMLTPAFGYFEASKYERQELLRLVYAFLLEPLPDAPGPHWRRLLVEPATTHSDLGEWVGLEDFRREP